MVGHSRTFVHRRLRSDTYAFSPHRLAVSVLRSKQAKLTYTLGAAFLRTLFFRNQPRWAGAALWVTRRCNLSCPYCFVNKNEGNDLQLDLAIPIIEKLFHFGCRYLAFYGGEPILNSALPAMVRYASKLGIFTACHTNGTLLTQDYVRELGDSGLDLFDIAVDHCEGSESGKSLMRVLPVLNLLICESKRYRFEVKLNHCVSKDTMNNIHYLLQVVDHFHILLSIHLALPDPFGMRQLPYHGWFQIPDDGPLVERMAMELVRKEKKGDLLSEPSEYFKKMVRFVKGLGQWHCEAGLHTIAINNDGRVMQCVSCARPENVHFLSATNRELADLKGVFLQRLATCNHQCFSCASFNASYFRKRPLQFLRKMFFWFANGTRKRFPI